MESERTIGRVVLVDTYRVIIEVDEQLKSLVKGSMTGVHDFARVNGYVVIPVGSSRVIAMLTRVQLREEFDARRLGPDLVLPTPKRTLTGTMVGTIDAGREFTQGVVDFPPLDSPVWYVSADELKLVFGAPTPAPGETAEFKPNKPGYCLPVGRSAAFPDYPVRIDPDAFFGKHAAVLGTTGSGKSCTVAAVLQSVLRFETPEEQPRSTGNAHFVILDTNGEYAQAFRGEPREGQAEDAAPKGDSFVIDRDGLVIPHWFMSFDDFCRLFRAAPGVQQPVLHQAVALAREGFSPAGQSNGVLFLLRWLRHVRDTLVGFPPEKGRYYVPDNLKSLTATMAETARKNEHHLARLEECSSHLDKGAVLAAITAIHDAVATWPQSGYDLTEDLVVGVADDADHLHLQLLDALRQADLPKGAMTTVDSPAYFPSQELSDVLGLVIDQGSRANSRIRENCASLELRVRRYLMDSRFDFLFGDVDTCPAALATFLRYVLGALHGCKCPSRDAPFCAQCRAQLGLNADGCGKDVLDGRYSRVVVLDLSLLAAEVLENVTALLGRLILEFLQRMAQHDPARRGEFPVVLVLEEAHHYIPVRDAEKPEDQSVSKKVFERIAKEGRKYGLGLLVASQRPSELSHTVLAQCNSFIVHRLQNPRDLEYFKSVVPAAFEDLLGQLPVLPQQTAMVLGECVPAPVLMRVNDAVPTPRSEDPRFMDHWISEKAYEPPFEDICAEWEGCTAGAVASEDEASACAGCCEDGCGCAEVVDCSYEFEQQGLDNGLDAATLLAAHGEPPDAAWLADAYEEWSAQAQEEGDG